MVVRDRVGRRRYVAFRVEGGADLALDEVVQALREASQHLPEEARPWVVRFQDGQGIVRCDHRYTREARELLQGLLRIGDREVGVRTLGTSGTIRKTVRKYLS